MISKACCVAMECTSNGVFYINITYGASKILSFDRLDGNGISLVFIFVDSSFGSCLW